MSQLLLGIGGEPDAPPLIPDAPLDPERWRLDDEAARPLVRSICGPERGRDDAVGAWWLTLSTFHKEIRRSDVERAMVYGRALAMMGGNAKLRRYLLGLCFEETLDVDLASWQLEHGARASWEAILWRLLRARKRWELSGLVWRERARLALKAQPRLGLDPDAIHARAQAPMALAQADALLHDATDRARPDRDLAKLALWEGLISWAPEPTRTILAGCAAQAPSSLLLGALVELSCMPELLEEATRPLERGQPSWLVDYYRPAPYGYDRHSRWGVIALKRHRARWAQHIARREQPRALDLRWSATAVGALWRHEARARAAGEEDWRQQDLFAPFDASPGLLEAAMRQTARDMPQLFSYPGA